MSDINARNTKQTFAIECDDAPNISDTLNEYNEFAYVVSHDLQSPIRQLKGFTDCLLESMDTLTSEQQSYKDMIDHVANQAEKTLDALLVFSRLNTDEKFFAPLDTNALIEEVLSKLGTHRKSFNGAITLAPDMPQIYGDHTLMIQTFYNIISNAIKFQPKGQAPIIDISCDTIDGRPQFCIADNGIGMDPAKTKTAFVILRKLVPEKDYPGRGAGLSFAKKIIEIHKGDIWIETAPDQGTKIYFTLSLTAQDKFTAFARPIT